MREIFVSELVKNVLGPRNGPDETIPTNPAFEYVTGRLAPLSERQQDHDPWQAIPEEQTSRVNRDDQYDEDTGEIHPQDPALDPKGTPSTMGLSFFVESENPKFRVCVTWARYSANDCGWVRKPRHEIFEAGGSDSVSPRLLQSENSGDRILFHYNTEQEPEGSGATKISMFVENQMSAKSKNEWTQCCVFQPQIRVVCASGTKIVQGFRPPSLSSTEAEADLIYRGSPFLAKGHLTSALWREVDPEREMHNVGTPDEKSADSAPFMWTDGSVLSDADRDEFSPPDVRTEYVPICSVPTPSTEWANPSRRPVLEAAELAEMYEPDRLRDAVSPMVDEYRDWIDETEKGIAQYPKELREEGRKVVGKCRDVCRRIESGVEMLTRDEKARLAFCFANKVMELQYSWTKGEGMTYRPFQLAFILATLESVINQNSKERGTCDLLWVPTGVGKTEAYLAVVAMMLAYRRLACRGKCSGSGVSVITRYTLRLLTIQQFRRTLSVITAADYLRVSDLGAAGPTGWRPANCPNSDDFLWGAEPFSAGLWVGESLTPNRLKTWYGRKPPAFGAIDMLKDKTSYAEREKDPAQITECPACSGILAVPNDGLNAGKHRMYFVVHAEGDLQKCTPQNDAQKSGDVAAEGVLHAMDLDLQGINAAETDDIAVECIQYAPHSEPGFFTICVDTKSSIAVKPHHVSQLWRSINLDVRSKGVEICLCSASARYPGYFIRTYIKKTGKLEEYDFDIICPNPDCHLRSKWMGGSPQGKVHGRTAGTPAEDLPGGTLPEDVIIPFRDGSPHVSDRVPIKAFTVDEQVYREAPSVVVATVDKFARLPFEPKAGCLFGNVSFHHCLWGYARQSDYGEESGNGRYRGVDRLARPDLIIQDELHLIEGPLGSMVGAYESAVDFLSSGNGPPVKYIASTATITNPDDHVRSVLNRNLMLFPPVSIDGKRFFVNERPAHQIDDRDPGRLYVGVCCPGRGPLTPIVRLWAGLSQTARDCLDRPDVDPADVDRFWTLTGYFNSVRELAGARAMYQQDIPERINAMSANPRDLGLDSSIELSSRTDSARLPSILNRLSKGYPDAIDGLFTTSMFGTGVDVPRIGLMLVNGQPKTATSYIQSTGRVGRRSGALVVTFFRASRPRDLNHYEFFVRHHTQLHRFIEPVTVHPFSPGILDGAMGPVALGMLRNMQTSNVAWGSKDGRSIIGNREAHEITAINDYLIARSSSQPKERRPRAEDVSRHLDSGWDRWECVARDESGIEYYDYQGVERAVVLGGQQHHDRANVVFKNAPRSLREMEDETGFET